MIEDDVFSEVAVQLRPAIKADIAPILAIQEQSFSDGHICARQWRYLISKANGDVLVAVDGQEVCGYLVLLTPKHTKSARVYSVAVAFAYRRNGIGSQLINSAKQRSQSKQKSKLQLEMRASSRSLTQFYQQLGFVPQQVLPNYYGEGKNGLRMGVLLR